MSESNWIFGILSQLLIDHLINWKLTVVWYLATSLLLRWLFCLVYTFPKKCPEISELLQMNTGCWLILTLHMNARRLAPPPPPSLPLMLFTYVRRFFLVWINKFYIFFVKLVVFLALVLNYLSLIWLFSSGQGRVGTFGRPGGRGQGIQRGRGRGRGQGGGHHEKLSAEDLDTDLEKYHAEAMQLNWRNHQCSIFLLLHLWLLGARWWIPHILLYLCHSTTFYGNGKDCF